MQIQKKVILSLGSNVGNRLENIEACLQLIHHKIGLILRVSSLYETPSWGFDSSPFYNCAILIHSSFSPEKILRKITSIEKEMGRIRKIKQGYEDRIIDIDIIALDNTIIESENLIIPHPQMQNRQFVLQPIADLQLDWEHPILHKSIKELLEICPDKSDCIAVSDLTSPIKNCNVNQINYIAIEGNIGAGKTTLATKIS